MSTNLISKIGAIGNQANLATDLNGNPIGIVNTGLKLPVLLISSVSTDLITARANSTLIQNAINALGIYGGTIALSSTANSPVYLSATAIATLNASGLQSAYCFNIPSNVSIIAPENLIIGKAFNGSAVLPSLDTQQVFAINTKHDSTPLVVSSATYAIGFGLPSGNFGYPNLVTFNVTGNTMIAGDAFQVIGELSDAGYNEQTWQVATATSSVITAYTSKNIGAFVADANTWIIPCNENIIIQGGIWDGGSLYNHASGSSLNGCGFLFNKVNNLQIKDFVLQNGPHYGVLYTNTRDLRISNVKNHGFANAFMGFAPFYNVVIDGMESESCDDSIATTGSCDNGYSSSQAYGDMTMWHIGGSDIIRPRINMLLNNIKIRGAGNIALYSGPGEFSGIVVQNVSMSTSITFSGLNTVTEYPTYIASHAYALLELAVYGIKVYRCTVAGTSSAGTPPTGRGSSIADGTVTWAYHSSLTPNNYINDVILSNITFNTATGIPSINGVPNVIGSGNFIHLANGSEVLTIGNLTYNNITVNNTGVLRHSLSTLVSGLTVNNWSIDGLSYKNSTAWNVISGNTGGNGTTTVASAGICNKFSLKNTNITVDRASQSQVSSLFSSSQAGGVAYIENSTLNSSTPIGANAVSFVQGAGSIDLVKLKNCTLNSGTYITSGTGKSVTWDGGYIAPCYVAMVGANITLSNLKSTLLTDEPLIKVVVAQGSLTIRDCDFDFKTATTSNGTGITIYNGASLTNVLIDGTKFDSSDHGTGNFSVINGQGTGNAKVVTLNGCTLKGGAWVSNIASLTVGQWNVSNTYFSGASGVLVTPNAFKINLLNCVSDTTLAGGAVFNSWGTAATLQINSIGCDFNSSPLGLNGTNNIIKLAVYGWMGSGAFATWGTTPTVSALGKY